MSLHCFSKRVLSRYNDHTGSYSLGDSGVRTSVFTRLRLHVRTVQITRVPGPEAPEVIPRRGYPLPSHKHSHLIPEKIRDKKYGLKKEIACFFLSHKYHDVT